MSAESVNFYNTFLAILALVALFSAVTLVGYRIVRGGDGAAALGSRNAILIAWLVAAVATAGSLIYSEMIHFTPCRLCWYQRIAMYPMSIILLVGAIRREAAAKFYALPLALGGLLISIWHYLVQIYPTLEGGSCDPTNPCSARYVEVFGFISIPFMAGAGFTLIAVLLLFYVKANRQ
jgi:disulfide bond formation protein DsbB